MLRLILISAQFMHQFCSIPEISFDTMFDSTSDIFKHLAGDIRWVVPHIKILP